MSNNTQIYIEDEIKASYLDYSMSVILQSTAGCKRWAETCSQKNTFAMHELGMTHDKPHKKSARIVERF